MKWLKPILLTGWIAVSVLPASGQRYINFDYADGEAGVEVFTGITSRTTLNLDTYGRVLVDTNLWLEMAVTDSSQTRIDAHINQYGLGAVGNPGANQLSAGEILTLRFFDAETAGTSTNIEITEIRFEGFGGTSGTTDVVIVSTGVLPDITISANTNQSGIGYIYTQEAAGSSNGDGLLTFTTNVVLSTLVLTDDSTGSGGSRLDRVAIKGSDPGSGPGPDPDPDPNAPNIIFIIVDDMGYSDVGCYGGEIETPQIDRLAVEGLSFRQFYNCAKCGTTRATLMSGLYHGRAGGNVENGASLAEALRSGGYRTYAVGKWHLSDSNGGDNLTPIDRGFHNYYGHYSGASSYFPSGIGTGKIHLDSSEDNAFVTPYDLSYFTTSSSNYSQQTSYPTNFYLTDAFGDHAVESINDAVTQHTNRPFFLYLAFNAPHTPLQAPVSLIDKYRYRYTNGWDVLRAEKWERLKEMGFIDPGWQLSNLREDIPPWTDLDSATQDIEDHRRAVYSAMVDSVDQNIGKVLAKLDELDQTTHPGIVNKTIIMFMSDNGAQAFDKASAANRLVSPNDPDSSWNPGPAWAAFSNTPFRYHKQSQHQGGISTPFIVRWPDVVASADQLTDQPGHVVDVMATLVDVANVNYSALNSWNGSPVPPLDGGSLLPIFQGQTRPLPDYLGFEFSKSEFAVIQDDWKLVNFRGGPWRLFNLKEDRTETRNLIWKNPLKAGELAALYDEWAQDTYGNDSHVYAKRDSTSNLTQHMRYEVPQTGELYSQPPVGVQVAAIGNCSTSEVTELSELWTVISSGDGIGDMSDGFTFLHTPFFGDGEVIARVESIAGAALDGLAGVMIRETLDPDSRFVMTSLNPGGACSQFVRMETNTTSTAPTTVPGISTMAFLRLMRRDNTFTSSYSTNGWIWTDINTMTVDMNAAVYAGMASSSHDDNLTGTFIYSGWESPDIRQYPEQSRLIDGLPKALGYALGANEETSARDRLPALTFSPLLPQLVFSRRLGLSGVDLSIFESPELLPASWSDNTTNWTEINATPMPDGVSERVLMERVNPATETQGFFRPEFDVTLP